MRDIAPSPLSKRSSAAEFNRGATYERYSGEQTRARVTTEGAALGGVAAGAAAGASSLSGAKLAGTPLGQAGLSAAENKLRLSSRTGSPHAKLAADQVARYKRYGQWAGKNKLKATGGILAAGAAAGAARLGQKARQNEEAGISQGIGRMKAGEHYARVRQHAQPGSFGKSIVHEAALSSDLLLHPRFGEAARKVLEHRQQIAMGGAAAGVAGAGVVSARVGQKHAVERQRLRGELRQTKRVAKGGRGFILTGLATGSAGLGGSEALRRKGKDDAGRDLAASTIGGWAGQGAYQAAGYGAKHYGLHHLEPKTTKAQRNKQLKPVKAKHGAYTPAMERNYPKTLPEWPVHRTLGWTHRGRTGTALGGAASAAGGMLALREANKPAQRKAKEPLEKLYVRDQQTSMSSLVTAGAGLALGAWGLGNSRMVGAALGRGIKMARGRQNSQAVSALQTAQALQGVLQRGMAPSERALRQVRAVDRAVSRVPAAIRPEIALAAGTLLVGHARPIRRDTYHPVNIRVRTGGF